MLIKLKTDCRNFVLQQPVSSLLLLTDTAIFLSVFSCQNEIRNRG
ncbi:hypothetical protein PREVCOP_04994 [Segatella copri DSM 18205]|uniref:Uncharacterized protein n=1 Tax=Segatella copri DSM 18205 TaxID=537011 RepID=D1PCQ9_9BACT|nr:hypothetical protein PREVCOP_04994 [Segatella copri DSM 18205]